jgi:F-type H+-transporting ATPase subunit beta
MNTGKIVRITGVVVDVKFDSSNVPAIYDALELKGPDGEKIVLETQQQLGDGVVRTIAMNPIDGVQR